MMAQKQPAFRISYFHEKYPSSEGTDIYRWARRPYADKASSGGFAEGRIKDIGSVTRELTDFKGNYKNSGFRASVGDEDRFYRKLLGGATTKHVINREMVLEVLSDVGRAAGDPYRTIFRGLLTALPLELGLKGGLEAEDFIGSSLSPLNLNKVLPQRTWNRDLFPEMHRDLIGVVQPIIYGEVSDEGATDSEGYNAEKGRVKTVWLGYDWDLGYHIFGVCGHAIKSINQWYASDLSEISTPDRVRQEVDTAGVDFLIPGWSGWPHANPYIEVNGQRMTVIYAAGPRAEHHIQGYVNITLNVCGIEDVGDGSGDLIDQAFPAIQHLFEQWVVANDGKGYYTGNWASAPVWPNSGLSIVKSSSFAAAQELSKTFLGDSNGYRIVFDLDNPVDVRELMRYGSNSYNAFFGVDWNGRLLTKLLNDTPDPDAGLLIRDRIEAISMPPPQIMWSETENKIGYYFGWDNDQDKWAADLEVIQANDSIDALKAVFEPQSPIPLRMVGHVATARDAMARRLLRLKWPPKYLSPKVNLCGLDVDLGDQFRATSFAEGLGETGYTNKPYFIMGSTFSGNREEITLRGLDLETIAGPTVITGFPEDVDFEYEFTDEGFELR